MRVIQQTPKLYRRSHDAEGTLIYFKHGRCGWCRCTVHTVVRPARIHPSWRATISILLWHLRCWIRIVAVKEIHLVRIVRTKHPAMLEGLKVCLLCRHVKREKVETVWICKHGTSAVTKSSCSRRESIFISKTITTQCNRTTTTVLASTDSKERNLPAPSDVHGCERHQAQSSSQFSSHCTLGVSW